jgi:hypothetical protein
MPETVAWMLAGVGDFGGHVPRRNGPMLTPGTSAYVAGIFLPAYPDTRYLMCCGIW